MTKAEARQVVRWFQENVGLLGWDVAVTIGDPPSDLAGDIYPSDRSDWYGRSLPSAAWRTCAIWVNPAAHDGDNHRACDITETLFHELLHGFFAECGIGEDASSIEWCLNQLATILSKQYRADNA